VTKTNSSSPLAKRRALQLAGLTAKPLTAFEAVRLSRVEVANSNADRREVRRAS
jgi:hypothetical protein